MVMKQSTFRAGWRLRPETVEGAARQILDMLEGFAVCIPELRKWSCEPPPSVPAPLTYEHVSQRLERSAKRLGRPQLGFSFTAWSGTKERAFGLRTSIGSTSRVVPSSRVNLAFPVELSPTDEIVRCILSTMARVWKPEFAAYNPVYPEKERRFELGDMVFLPPETEAYLGDLSAQKFRREPFESGHLYTLRPEEIERLYQQAMVSG